MLFPVRVTIFIISLLLLTEAVGASEAWLITLAVLAGVSLGGAEPGWRRRVIHASGPRRLEETRGGVRRWVNTLRGLVGED